MKTEGDHEQLRHDRMFGIAVGKLESEHPRCAPLAGFFNAYYDHECYALLLIFCGRQMLASKLRASNLDPAAGALEELQRIIAQIRTHWSDVVIVVRGDSAYGR